MNTRFLELILTGLQKLNVDVSNRCLYGAGAFVGKDPIDAFCEG